MGVWAGFRGRAIVKCPYAGKNSSSPAEFLRGFPIFDTFGVFGGIPPAALAGLRACIYSAEKMIQVGADAWNPEAGILGLHIGKDNLKKIEQILTNEKYC